MGTRNFHCYLCGDPLSYACQSSEEPCPGNCKAQGRGEVRAYLDFYRFPRVTAPRTSREFLANRNKADSRERREYEYDLEAQEFVPSLDYKGYQEASSDQDRSVWRLNNSDDTSSADNYPAVNDVHFERQPESTVWVINHCPTCYQAFLLDSSPSKLCRVHLQAVADKHEIELKPSRSIDSAFERLQKAMKARYL